MGKSDHTENYGEKLNFIEGKEVNGGVAMGHTNGHFLAGTTKNEQWLVLVGRPSLAAISVGGRGRPPHCGDAMPHCTEARPNKRFPYKIKGGRW